MKVNTKAKAHTETKSVPEAEEMAQWKHMPSSVLSHVLAEHPSSVPCTQLTTHKLTTACTASSGKGGRVLWLT